MIKKIAQYAPDPADNPTFRIENMARVTATVIVEEQEIPLLEPSDLWENFMDFDRNAVKLGYKEFVRPVMESEGLPKNFKATHVFVAGNEYARIREFLNL